MTTEKKYYIDIEKVIRRIVDPPYYKDEMIATRRWLIENADYVVCERRKTDIALESYYDD